MKKKISKKTILIMMIYGAFVAFALFAFFKIGNAFYPIVYAAVPEQELASTTETTIKYFSYGALGLIVALTVEMCYCFVWIKKHIIQKSLCATN